MSIIALYLIFSMLTVMYFDATRFIIPNWLVGALLLVYPIAVFLAPVAVDWKMDLLGMLGAFVLGYVIFALRIMGGGDVKLIIVLSLWVGVHKLAIFGFNFALLGGILGIVLLLLRQIIPLIVGKNVNLPRILRNREPVPYGLAIAGSFLMLIFSGDIPLAGL